MTDDNSYGSVSCLPDVRTAAVSFLVFESVRIQTKTPPTSPSIPDSCQFDHYIFKKESNCVETNYESSIIITPPVATISIPNERSNV